MVGIGLISYSAYLWHQPILAFAKIQFDESILEYLLPVLCWLTFFLAYMSWKFVERPFRLKSGKGSINSKTFILSAVLCTAFLGGFSYAAHKTHGFEKYYIDFKFETNAEQIAFFQKVKKHTRYDFYKSMQDDGECRFWGERVEDDLVERFDACAEKHGKALIVLGDSHAMNMHNIFVKADIHPFIFGISQGACRAHSQYSFCHYKLFDQFLKMNADKIDIVFYHQSGSYYIEDENGKFSSDLAFRDGKSYAISEKFISKTLEYLQKLSQHTKVVWLGAYAEARVDPINYDAIFNAYRFNKQSLQAFAELEKTLPALIAPQLIPGRLEYFSIHDRIGLDENSLIVDDCITFRDQDHFSRCGEDLMVEKLKKPLEEIVKDL